MLFIVMDELRSNITVDRCDTTFDERCCLMKLRWSFKMVITHKRRNVLTSTTYLKKNVYYRLVKESHLVFIHPPLVWVKQMLADTIQT